MSTLTADLCKKLSNKGTLSVIEGFATFFQMDTEQKDLVLKYLTESTQEDRTELSLVKELLSRYRNSPTPVSSEEMYEKHDILAFMQSMADIPPITLYQDDKILFRIERPYADIRLIDVAKWVTPNQYAASRKCDFEVNIQVSGFNSQAYFTPSLEIEYERGRTAQEWLNTIVLECQKWFSYNNRGISFGPSPNIIQNMLNNPCKETTEAVKSYPTLVEYTLNILRPQHQGIPIMNTYVFSQYVSEVLDALTANYAIRENVGTDLVTSLIEISDTFGFEHLGDCLVFQYSLDKRKNAPIVILVKKDENWVRVDKGNAAYKRLQLAKKLQQ